MVNTEFDKGSKILVRLNPNEKSTCKLDASMRLRNNNDRLHLAMKIEAKKISGWIIGRTFEERLGSSGFNFIEGHFNETTSTIA